MGSAARVAIYYAPLVDDPLTGLSSAWLGRDPASNAPVQQPEVDGIAEFTAEPRRYGFHATLKPPMHLVDGVRWTDFVAAVRVVAAGIAPFELPRLAVADLRGFLALRETAPCPGLHALADACVTGTDRHRLAAGADELAKRRRHGLTAEEDALLMRWGYPHVLQRWRFHMTLTRRLDAAEMARMRPEAERHFAESLAAPPVVQDLAVFTQRDQQPFLVAERLPLGG